jgi:hypothetical protein
MIRTARYFGVASLVILSACAPKIAAPPLPPTQFHPVMETSEPLDSRPMDLAVLNPSNLPSDTSLILIASKSGRAIVYRPTYTRAKASLGFTFIGNAVVGDADAVGRDSWRFANE